MNLAELRLFSNADNIAEKLEDDKLQQIGTKCFELYQQDKKSRADWEKTIEKAVKLAKQTLEARSRPGMDSCANTNYPLVTVGAIQFNARSYPAIINSQMVTKGDVIGKDKTGEKSARAKRIGQHMSYQYLYEQEEWETDTDRLLLALPVMGDMFRKTFFNPLLGRNASKLIYPQDLVYDYDTPFEKVKRKTEVFELFPNDIEERKRNGIYLDIDLNLSSDEEEDEAPQTFLEQHCLLDLDEDGYKEPYIVTLTEKNHTIVRIVARFDFEEIIIKQGGKIAPVYQTEKITEEAEVVSIVPVEYYTQYYFIPSVDGKGYNLGLGELLENLSEQINTTLNQLIDAGTLANMQGGFIAKGLRIKKGRIQAALNEFIQIDTMSGMNLRENIVPFDFKGPSVVLFQLLGFLVDAARDISSVKDIMTGESAGANESPTVYVSRVNEGLKVFSAIYKRIHSSLKKEFKKQFRLNRKFMQPEQYFRVMDEEVAIAKQDYNHTDIDVTPVSDPTMATMTQKVAVNQALNAMFKGDPSIDQDELNRRTMEGMDVSAIDKLIIPPQKRQAPPPDPKAIEAEAKAMLVKPKVDETQANIAKTMEELKEIQVRTVQMIQDWEASKENAAIQLQKEKEELAGVELDNMQKAADLNATNTATAQMIDEIINPKKDGTD